MRHYVCILEVRTYGSRAQSLRGRTNTPKLFRVDATSLEHARQLVFQQARQRFPQSEFVERSITCESVRRDQ